MTPFERLDAHLLQPFSLDYWYDVAIERAQELAGDLDDDDFRALAAAWPKRPPAWHERLVHALRGAPGPRSARILKELILACDDRVVLAAIDSLNGLDDHALPEALDDAIAARLRAVAMDSEVTGEIRDATLARWQALREGGRVGRRQS